MADEGVITAMAGGLAAEIKSVFTATFRYAFKNFRFGPVEHQTQTTNFVASYVVGTTSTTVNGEFTIAHGRESVPMTAIPVLPLNVVNAQLVSVQVSRIADEKRLYFTSPSTNAAVAFLVE